MDAGTILPGTEPQVDDTWDVDVDEQPIVGDDPETVTRRRRLNAKNVNISTPSEEFTDCYEIAVEEIGSESGTALQRYEYWSPSFGGMVAELLDPDDENEKRWRRLARVTDDPGWHTPFAVQKTGD